jgi:hypothetical protein
MMVSDSNFIVRVSGRKENSFYIDYQGSYKISDISIIVGIDPPAVKEKYVSHGGIYDENLEVYYFNSIEAANSVIADILKSIKPEKNGRLICFTEKEIEYLRKALINEGVNTIHVSNKTKDAIFKKLNG